MMVQALVADLACIPGVRVVVAHDPAVALGPLPAEVRAVEPNRAWRQWYKLAAEADAVWPIAPETDGALERLTALADRAGRPVLNSRLDALAIARSKLATAHHLASRGIPVVYSVGAHDDPPPSEAGWVVKPDDGAGCENTIFLPDAPALERWRGTRPAGSALLQPFVPGPALSLSLLAQEGRAWLLTCNRQHVENRRGKFVYRGGVVGGAEDSRARLEPIAAQIAEALPGLWGYVGVDLIDGPAGPAVLEINPRLTTTYAGLGRSLGLNPAALVLALLDHGIGSLVRPLSPRPVEVAVPGLEAAA
jgi:predicted ATP-grasp superfamily ATP-dependent carboligase